METYLSIEGLANYLGIAEKTVRKWVLNHAISYHKIMKIIRFRVSEIEQWIETKEVQRRSDGLLKGGAKHILLFCGSRSGKITVLVMAIIFRALMYAGSRYLICRYRAKNARSSVLQEMLMPCLDNIRKNMSLAQKIRILLVSKPILAKLTSPTIEYHPCKLASKNEG